MRETVQAFGADAAHFDNVEALIAALRPSLRAGTTVLIKGSRFMQMERVAQALSAQKMESVH
jgi:UDP-N-acetylmuramoyl-tripeptide--D-alanyl-D-alanine ligase